MIEIIAPLSKRKLIVNLQSSRKSTTFLSQYPTIKREKIPNIFNAALTYYIPTNYLTI